MTKCCIVNCGARKGKNQPQLSLHRFPRNEKLKKEWLDAIGEENINPRLKEWFLCSLHFKESCFNRTLDVMRLHDNSVPTLFLALDKKQQQKSSVLCETQNLDVSCASTVASLQLPQQIVETVHIEEHPDTVQTFEFITQNICTGWESFRITIDLVMSRVPLTSTRHLKLHRMLYSKLLNKAYGKFIKLSRRDEQKKL